MSDTTGPYRIRINPDCFGANPTNDALPGDMPFDVGNSILIDLSDVTFVRPSGLAFVFALTFTLMRSGYEVAIGDPLAPDSREYLHRTNFWGVMEQQGFQIPTHWRGFNLGRAPGLIEPSIVRTDAPTRTNVESSLLLFDRLRAAMESCRLGRARPRGKRFLRAFSKRSRAFNESPWRICYGASISRTPPDRNCLADVGIGIRASLGTDRFATDAEATMAALRENVTGRRDPAGNPAEGGYGLPTVAEEADYLAIRTGSALLESHENRNEHGELLLQPWTVGALDGTLVVAIVSTQR